MDENKYFTNLILQSVIEKTIVAIPSYVYTAANKDIDWFYNCISQEMKPLTFTPWRSPDELNQYKVPIQTAFELERRLSKNDIADLNIMGKYVDSILYNKRMEINDHLEEKNFIDIRDMSMNSLNSMGDGIDMSSMKNLTPWGFESRGDFLFIILQDIFIGYMVKGDDLNRIKFITHVLQHFKQYYGEEALLRSRVFKRFIGLVI